MERAFETVTREECKKLTCAQLSIMTFQPSFQGLGMSQRKITLRSRNVTAELA